jgi:hypothetical protein
VSVSELGRLPLSYHARAGKLTHFVGVLYSSCSGPMQPIERMSNIRKCHYSELFARDRDHARYDFLTQDTVKLLRNQCCRHPWYDYLLAYANIWSCS